MGVIAKGGSWRGHCKPPHGAASAGSTACDRKLSKKVFGDLPLSRVQQTLDAARVRVDCLLRPRSQGVFWTVHMFSEIRRLIISRPNPFPGCPESIGTVCIWKPHPMEPMGQEKYAGATSVASREESSESLPAEKAFANPSLTGIIFCTPLEAGGCECTRHGRRAVTTNCLPPAAMYR